MGYIGIYQIRLIVVDFKNFSKISARLPILIFSEIACVKIILLIGWGQDRFCENE
jgi:hypothetical protein